MRVCWFFLICLAKGNLTIPGTVCPWPAGGLTCTAVWWRRVTRAVLCVRFRVPWGACIPSCGYPAPQALPAVLGIHYLCTQQGLRPRMNVGLCGRVADKQAGDLRRWGGEWRCILIQDD